MDGFLHQCKLCHRPRQSSAAKSGECRREHSLLLFADRRESTVKRDASSSSDRRPSSIRAQVR